MGKVNGGARLSYVRLDVTVHRFTEKAVLLSQGMEGAGEQTWVPRTALSYSAEKHVDSIDVFPAAADDLEIVKWKVDQLGWKP